MWNWTQPMENKLSKMTDYNKLYQIPFSYPMPHSPWYPPVSPFSAGSRPEPSLESGSERESEVNPAEYPVPEFNFLIDPTENKLSVVTDYNKLFQKPYPYHLPHVPLYQPVSPFSAGSRPEPSLESGSEQESEVNPAESPDTKFNFLIYPTEDQLRMMTDRMKELEDALRKSMEDQLRMMTDYNDLYHLPYSLYYPPVSPVYFGSRPEPSLESGSERESEVNPAESPVPEFNFLIDPSEDEELLEHLKLGVEEETDDGLYMMSDWNELNQEQFSHIAPYDMWYPPVSPVYFGSRPEPSLESESERESKVNPLELHQRDITSSRYMYLTQSDCREKPPKYGTTGTSRKRKRDLEEEGSDSTEPEHEPREKPSSDSDSDGKSSCVSFKSDGSMMRFIDFKGSRPSAPKSDMADRMKEREDAVMAHITLKRKLEEEGSDSTEHEPRDEPSSHSDSDAKSSCVSFNSDRSMGRFIDLKGFRPSALKKKRLEDEGSDSTESDSTEPERLPEPREEASSDTD